MPRTGALTGYRHTPPYIRDVSAETRICPQAAQHRPACRDEVCRITVSGRRARYEDGNTGAARWGGFAREL
jgi:hypothetical protein